MRKEALALWPTTLGSAFPQFRCSGVHEVVTDTMLSSFEEHVRIGGLRVHECQ